MAYTLLDALQSIAAIVDQDTTAGQSGTDLTVRVNLINQALRDWGNAYQWQELRINNFSPTFALSATSIGLPQNFKILMSRPFNVAFGTASAGVNNDYEEIRPEDRFQKTSTDRYCYTGGNFADGNYIVINPALTSGVSLTFDYQMYPSSLATLQDILPIAHLGFITKRVIAKIYEARSDPRFPQFMEESTQSLENMMTEEASLSGGFDNKTRTYYERHNFRIGET